MTNLQELVTNKTQQVLGLFAPLEHPKQIDRDPTVPSISQMTTGAIQRLQQNPNGFLSSSRGKSN